MLAFVVLAATSSTSRAIITPIGPFCPFRSKACGDGGPIDTFMSRASSKVPSFAADMARLQLDAQMGNAPDLGRLRELTDELDTTFRAWQQMLEAMDASQDFQALEYFTLTRAHLARKGQSFESLSQAIGWQVEAMRAVCEDRPPPPPPDMPLEAAASAGSLGASSLAPPTIDAPPFTDGAAAFESEVVRDEYSALVRDHAALVAMGERYGSFDPRGKLAFLDEIEKIEARWDTFFARFVLLGTLNPEFTEQGERFLEALELGQGEFRELLRDAHERMRTSAKRDL